MNQHDLGRGIVLSVAASALFALMSGYTKWLAPLDGLDICAWRIVWTLPGALALIALRNRWPQLCALVSKLAKTPHLLLAFAAVAALPGLGALSTIALASYLRASRHLPLALFGVLGYVEPVLLVGVAVLLLGEPFSARQLGTYVPIWIAVVLTGVHSGRLVMCERSRKAVLPMSEHHASARAREGCG
ncbi:MAG: Uncharacterized inner membrane protein RarD [uncultured Caballeronia sp.]|nr:MAG: Uncharacterized inner membrane protein RarD [uncultured Caballeronia sp.]